MSRRLLGTPYLVSRSQSALSQLREEMFVDGVVEFGDDVESEGDVWGLRIIRGREDVTAMLSEMIVGYGYDPETCNAARETCIEEWSAGGTAVIS